MLGGRWGHFGESSSFEHEIKYFQRKTLQLLSELAVGYATVRKLVKLDSVKQLLHNHQEFPFLQINQDAFDSKKTVKRLKVSVKLSRKTICPQFNKCSRIEHHFMLHWVVCWWLILVKMKKFLLDLWLPYRLHSITLRMPLVIQMSTLRLLNQWVLISQMTFSWNWFSNILCVGWIKTTCDWCGQRFDWCCHCLQQSNIIFNVIRMVLSWQYKNTWKSTKDLGSWSRRYHTYTQM